MPAVRAEPYTFLDLLSEEDCGNLMDSGGVRRFNRGEHLMHQDEPGDRVLILLQGHVKVSFTDSQGTRWCSASGGPGTSWASSPSPTPSPSQAV